MPSRGHGTLPQGLPSECFLREKMGHETAVQSFLFSVFLVSLHRKINRGTAQGEKRDRELDQTVVLVFRDQPRQEVGVEGWRGTPICQAEWGVTDMEHSPWVGGTSTNQAARTKMTGPKS